MLKVLRGMSSVKRFNRTLVLLCTMFAGFLTLNVAEAEQTASNLQAAASGNLSKKQIDLLIKRFAGRPHKSFSDFCLSIYNSSRLTLTGEQRLAVGNFSLNKDLDGRQREVIFRILGIYAQLKYGGDGLRLLAELVEIPTVYDSSTPQHRNKNFIKAAKLLKSKATEFGLKFRNIDNRVYEVGFPWFDRNGKTVALHAHVDVVPADPKAWRLANGRQINPFKLTRVEDKFYGRGAQDDKNAIVVTMYAMRVIVEERIRLFNNMRLLIDTTEETSGEAMPYYLKSNPLPDYNIALDGDYPVVIAEKGYGVIKAQFPVENLEPSEAGNAHIVAVSGGLAYNQIPAVSRASIKSGNAQNLSTSVNQLAAVFVQKYGGNFTLQAQAQGDLVNIELAGASAHSSEPQGGVNPVSRMMLFINTLKKKDVIDTNHFTNAAAYVAENWGIGYLGQSMGIAYQHDFMGPLTASVTKLANDGELFEVGINLRIPVGQPLATLEATLNDKLSAWRELSGVPFNLTIETQEPMFRDPKGLWLNALRTIATESLNLPNRFASSAGSTAIHDLPNGVQFGLSMPNEKYTGHNALEFKTVDQFLVDMQIVTEMMARLGQMRRLD